MMALIGSIIHIYTVKAPVNDLSPNYQTKVITQKQQHLVTKNRNLHH